VVRDLDVVAAGGGISAHDVRQKLVGLLSCGGFQICAFHSAREICPENLFVAVLLVMAQHG